MFSLRSISQRVLCSGALGFRTNRVGARFSSSFADGGGCVYPGCKCEAKKITQLFQNPNDLKKYVKKNCRQFIKVNRGSHLLDFEDTCKVWQVAEEIISIDPSKKTPFRANMFAFMEERKKLTLAGESGKITGNEVYWKDLKVHLSNSKSKSFFVYSFGGGQGYDGKSIYDLFVSHGFTVAGFKIIEINKLAYHLSEYKEHFIVKDGTKFLQEFPKRDKGILNVFHLGNFLTVLKVKYAIEFLTEMASKMEEGDIASILVVRKEQFQKKKSLQKVTETESQGLVEFNEVSKKGERFFRTTVSDIESFNDFIGGLGLSMTFEKIDEDLDEGPRRMKMLFVKVSAYKKGGNI
ncbi:MAG: hypothetical protein K940chlam7_02073 [Chlamydiae bacterium]|nr:hypothetical protein [Chlamydiota bacterium]